MALRVQGMLHLHRKYFVKQGGAEASKARSNRSVH
jgi:hypothetical protein